MTFVYRDGLNRSTSDDEWPRRITDDGINVPVYGVINPNEERYRQDSEATRQAQEAARVSNESQRVENELARQQGYQQMIEEADQHIEDSIVGAMSAGNKTQDAVYVTTANTTAITIPFNNFQQLFDMLFVDVNGLDLAEGDDYEIIGNTIELVTPIPAGQEVHFRALSYQLSDADKNIQVENYYENYIANGGCVKAFDTVADMRAATLEEGDVCHTNGFHTSGDGGAAWYEITDTGTANEMDVIECGNLFANLILDKKNVKVKQFGVIGNGSNDDTQAFQRCIDASGGNSIIYINCNNIRVSATIVISNNNCHLKGNNHPEYVSSISTARNSAISPVLDITGKITSLEGIQILKEFENQDTHSGIGIRVKRANPENDNTWYNMDCYIRKCYISGFDIAADCYGRNIIFQDDTHFSNCNNGVFYHSANGSLDVSQRGWIVENCRFHSIGKAESEADPKSPSYVGVKTDLNARCQEIIIKNCIFDGSSTCFMYFGTSDGLVIDGNIAEFNSNVVIGYVHQPTSYYARVYPVIQNNVIVQANNHAHCGIYTETLLYLIGSYLYFSGNTIKTIGTEIIQTSGGTLIKIINNVFEAISSNTTFFKIVSGGSNTSAAVIGNTFDTESSTQTGCILTSGNFTISNSNFDNCNFRRSLISKTV